MLDIKPHTATIGCEVSGIDLANVDAETFAELQKLWLDWKVLFFRDQPITTEEHIAFGRRFGELEIHPFIPNDGAHPEIVVINSTAEFNIAASAWHSDVTWRVEPSLGSILRGRVIPRVGGDTLFANAAAAYNRLSDTLKQKIDGLIAVHDFAHVFSRKASEEKLAELHEKYPPALHPVVRTHPETGERVIYTNRDFTTHIDGIDPDESRKLLHRLELAIMDPSIQCRFRWETDSFAMWDNRCTQHFATDDFFPENRRVERVTIKGDRPR